jgi:hypothetical protein
MLVDSKERELEVEPIIILGADELGSNMPPATIYAAVIAELNEKNVTLFKEGNTLFIVHHIGPREGFFRAINADTARNYLENSYTFIQVAQKYGYDVLHSHFENPTVLNIFKAISRNPPFPGMGYSVKKEKGGFAVTLQLGEPREV